MLSYRHAFHAGNHADVLKHWLLVECLSYMNQKDKPYWYIDTHAGAGAYKLDNAMTSGKSEYASGIGKLWAKCPAPLREYLNIVKAANDSPNLRHYPGSPMFANSLLREDDKAYLYELHPQDFKLLGHNFAKNRQVKVQQQNGFDGLIALLPPAPRRALVMIDPPYEQASEYAAVVKTLQAAIKRFATGTYVVWYPLINSAQRQSNKQGEAQKMTEQLKNLSKDWLDVRLLVGDASTFNGMYGSGMFMLNPPWTLKAELEKHLPELSRLLGGEAGSYNIAAS
ncbi:MAG: 23S rRNA (adenine(2030)-N(6))-methyltransferase RlmJ [Oceanospirillaceae bacterium]|nr:23S rRNA (adenine(2030)-N(6))-methyltransferase RlmJ [Oceanospirillaceae bacterium]MCP5335415.1 23S rRNA (adenine(2030)-N(6))-methyltransferase RlmJ [Oceanospirillaceae bacterium]MCP5351414.1 23S rRNA (adenine(2030)-N(6))-methyltransferase RlmJ [Oceanospirillaceae bacterium]